MGQISWECQSMETGSDVHNCYHYDGPFRSLRSRKLSTGMGAVCLVEEQAGSIFDTLSPM